MYWIFYVPYPIMSSHPEAGNLPCFADEAAKRLKNKVTVEANGRDGTQTPKPIFFGQHLAT